jgi:hypothetical protein
MNDIGCSHVEHLVRRIAGLFILGSLALGYFWHPAWYLFTVFVGLNLFQSSFTNFCPLEMILKKIRKVEEEPSRATSSV